MWKSKGLWTTKTHQNNKGEDFHYYYKDKVHQAIIGGGGETTNRLQKNVKSVPNMWTFVF